MLYGRPALELINSALPGQPDLLDDPAWLLPALRRWEIDPGRAVSATERDQLRGLRRLLRGLAASLSERGELAPAELAGFNAVIGEVPVRTQLAAGRDGGYVLVMEPLSVRWIDLALRELAGTFGSLLRSDASRIRVCANPVCERAFYDESRSRTRRWCDSRACGNLMRVRKHRERRR
jgi:predicted RNA-binding Zn ribbon-like protein